MKPPSTPAAPTPAAVPTEKPSVGARVEQPPGEIGGPPGPEPTRYGDWEKGGRCTDF